VIRRTVGVGIGRFERIVDTVSVGISAGRCIDINRIVDTVGIGVRPG